MINISDFEMIPNKENKNKFGEVFTDINLIGEILSSENFDWNNPDQTFFDPTCGYGYFLFFVYDILMGNGFKYKGYENNKGLKEIIEGDDDRERHIIEKMIFGNDIQKSSIDKCNDLFMYSKYKTNFTCEDFIEYKSTMKFDNIIGNPPFENFKEGKRKAKNQNLWRPIILKSYSMLNDDGNMAFVCPQSWMSYSKSNSEMMSLFSLNDVYSINIGECKKYFKEVGSSFSFFVMKKSKSNLETHVTCDFKGKIYTSGIYLSDNKFFPTLLSNTSLSIINKTILNSREKFNLKFDSYLHAFTKKDVLCNKQGGDFIYKVWHTPNKVLWSKTKHPNYGTWKVLVPISTYYEQMLIDNCGNTQGMGYILCESEIEAEKIMGILRLKLYTFIVNITRWSNWNSPDILRSLPIVDIDKEWDDESLFREFNLTKEEISLINEIIKKSTI
jgi:hypothetical protein